MSLRTDRMNELVKQELGRFMMEELELPENSLVTISKVITTPDLKVAKVYITILPDKLRGTILELLNKKSRILHENLKSELSMKFVPNLRFIIDEQEIYANKIEQLLDEINKE
jgi:ribosome-binding factor A